LDSGEFEVLLDPHAAYPAGLLLVTAINQMPGKCE